jgi:hypothetical protein
MNEGDGNAGSPIPDRGPCQPLPEPKFRHLEPCGRLFPDG